MATQRKMLGDILVENGLISEEQLTQALADQKNSKEKLGRILVRRGYITDDQLMEVLEFSLGIPRVQINRMEINPETVKLLPTNMLSKHHVLPLSVNQGRMTLIMADPLNFQAIDDIRILTGMDVVPVMASERELESAIQQFTALQVDSKMEKLLGELSQYNYGVTVETETPGTELADDAPVIRMVNSLLKQAVQGGASDIHIEPLEHDVRVRFRIDGELWEVLSLPKKSFPATVSRIKIMANLDISEKRIPQDGRTRLIIDGREIDFRISTLPSIHGEKIVLRILDRTNAILSLEKLGFSPTNEQRIKSLIRRPHGMVIVTGPTGSGKTTTLYSVLTELNEPSRNIITLEDPVEYSLIGITQVQINNKAGLTFPAGLRSILRQDPDIIMVGEMRDGETAGLGVRAALTGHLFFSTLHTNSAAGTVARMVNMGIENYLLSSSLAGVVSQRLIRRLCKNCCQPYELDEDTAVQLNMTDYVGKQFYAPVGCNMCRQSGYSGRLALHEVLVVGPEMRKAITNKSQSEDELEEIAVSEGMITMSRDGIHKAFEGLTSLQEVMKGVLLGG
ncbi:MAG: Flp pilus assembly complex ATPase component TadA [Syntrophomonadaceae bacterium]|nr:Flp pilus assembly complex ATPase component TadA [Syntrophomonadaceae bacterium]